MKRTISRCVLLLALLTVCAMPAGAAQKKTHSKKSGSRIPAAPAAVGPECPAEGLGQAGFRAFIDPQTGQLREPSPEETRALARAAREELVRAMENLEAVVHPDGMISLDLKDLFMQDLVVVKRPDGFLSMQCVPDSERAGVTTAPTPAKPVPVLEER
jgi:hypothetical protein